MDNFINLIKLSVGTESIEGLRAWQKTARAQGPDGLPRHVTRMWPKREEAVTAGGSIYWVFKGAIQCRQRIVRFDEVVGSDGIRRCAIVLDPEIVATTAAPRRPFQGWRYLDPEASPPDLPTRRKEEAHLPPALEAALAEIGVR